ncbi:MAG: hypothetical protein M1834_001525 [Cirrosporium novae-zelandiae]|nr:MAG: hypothetical protein M1834_004042 [Cirrosporium novae-zelandiae]KAI9735510.1 MAG: hypothetical protein M1834_001525 [Cirrosporium novae-zelandiae]
MSSSTSGASSKVHYPIAPQNASLGGVPTVGLDVPITAVFLVLFVLGAISHMTILQLNNRKGHKFILSGMLFGFCMARITTCVLRIVWATRQNDIPVAIAAMIFVGAGVIILFVINVVFAQRVLRAAHPDLGWTKTIGIAIPIMCGLIIVSLIMLIITVVQQFYTINANTHRIDRDIQLAAQTYFAVMSFLPIPLVGLTLLLPRHTPRPVSSDGSPLPPRPNTLRRRASHVEKFGTGRWRTKVTILLISSVLLCLGATFRLGTNFKTPRPRTDPAWYQSKACFYVFNLGIEIIVVWLYIILRVDRRFHIPNGAKGKGSYSPKTATSKSDLQEASEGDVEKTAGAEAVSRIQSHHGFRLGRIRTEEEIFYQGPYGSDTPADSEDALKKSQDRRAS